MPTPISAQEARAPEPQSVAEATVPDAVRATARANYLDSRDVAYRRLADTNRYIVNFMTPTNLRMQVVIGPDGELLDGPQLSPVQAAAAPAGDERDRLAAEWVVRVQQAKQAPARPMPPRDLPPAERPPLERPEPPVAPAAPVPSAVPATPTTPGGPAAPAADPVSTEVASADVPKTAADSLERYTKGASDIRYYRQEAGEHTRYIAAYTDADGSRREVVVSKTGSLMSGPLVLVQDVDDKSLLNDRPATLNVASSVRVDPTDIPAAAMDMIGKYVQRANDVRYRRDTFTDGSVGYTTHWVQPNNERRYYLTVSPDGTMQQAPALSMYQPAASPNAQPTGVAVTWDSLPDGVKKTLQPVVAEDREARYLKQTQDGKIFYSAVYRDDGQQKWIRVDEAGQTVVKPTVVVAETPARKPMDKPEATPAAAKLTGDVLDFRQLPKVVQTKILEETRGAKDIITTRQTKNGVTVYHTVWTDSDGISKQVFLDEKGEAVPFKVE